MATSITVVIALETFDDTLSCIRSVLDFIEVEAREFFIIDRGHDKGVFTAVQSAVNIELKLLNATDAAWDQAWSAGIQAASSDFVLLISPDIRLVPRCVSTLMTALNENPGYTAAGPAIASGAASVPSNIPLFGNGVCILIRRERLFAGGMNLEYVSTAYATAGSVK
jgi:GT2 family glycosyltransferase